MIDSWAQYRVFFLETLKALLHCFLESIVADRKSHTRLILVPFMMFLSWGWWIEWGGDHGWVSSLILFTTETLFPWSPIRCSKGLLLHSLGWPVASWYFCRAPAGLVGLFSTFFQPGLHGFVVFLLYVFGDGLDFVLKHQPVQQLWSLLNCYCGNRFLNSHTRFPFLRGLLQRWWQLGSECEPGGQVRTTEGVADEAHWRDGCGGERVGSDLPFIAHDCLRLTNIKLEEETCTCVHVFLKLKLFISESNLPD